MLVGAKVCDLTEKLLWSVCGLYVGILTSPLNEINDMPLDAKMNGEFTWLFHNCNFDSFYHGG